MNLRCRRCSLDTEIDRLFADTRWWYHQLLTTSPITVLGRLCRVVPRLPGDQVSVLLTSHGGKILLLLSKRYRYSLQLSRRFIGFIWHETISEFAQRKRSQRWLFSTFSMKSIIHTAPACRLLKLHSDSSRRRTDGICSVTGRDHSGAARNLNERQENTGVLCRLSDDPMPILDRPSKASHVK